MAGTALKSSALFEVVQMDLLGGVVVEVAIAGLDVVNQLFS